MGIRVSTASPVTPEGLGYVIYDHEDVKRNGHRVERAASSLYSKQGGKGVNQDAAVICQGYGVEDGIFCGVFDGHGKNGHIVSKVVREHLPALLLDQKNVATNSDVELMWQEACESSFQEMDNKIKLMQKLDCCFSGTTAVVVLKQGEDLLIANLGDSRAVLGTRTEDGVGAIQLTTDLKPGTPDEADRIRKSNGRVFALKEEPGVARAWLPRVHCPGIAMSRCFGDFVMKKHGLICTPVVTHHRISSDDLFVVLATDGVWDVLSNEEVVSIVQGVEREEMAAKAVVDAAVAAWKTKLPYCVSDDCTAVCLFLQNQDQTKSAAAAC